MRSCIALVGLALASTACMEQAASDRSLAEIEAVRRDAQLRDGRMRMIEQQQVALAQQLSLMMTMTNATLANDSKREQARDRALGDLGAHLAQLSQMLRSWREEERPPPTATPQGSAEERAEAVRQVQALLDAGQVKLTVSSGRGKLVLLRPLDATNPYQAPAAKPAAPRVPPKRPSKRQVDQLGF